jgi:hypothetical protein
MDELRNAIIKKHHHPLNPRLTGNNGGYTIFTIPTKPVRRAYDEDRG